MRSPNYRDGKSLTPVYHSVINPTDPVVTETLLHDHGLIGSQDLQGWQEVHQVIIIFIVIVIIILVLFIAILILIVIASTGIGGEQVSNGDGLLTD